MDLSKVLDDVYETENRPAPAAASVPEWSDEQRLDEAFAEWTPGPHASAPAAEHEMAAHTSTSVPLDDDMAAALTAALSSEAPIADVTPTFPEVEPEPDSLAAALYAEPVPTPEPAEPTHWARGDDDVLVGTRRARGLRLRRR